MNNKINLKMLSLYRNELMGMAALGIILGHAGARNVYGIALFQRPISIFGTACVDIFMLLSGIGMYYSTQNIQNKFDWYKKRFIRIALPYLVISLPYMIWHAIYYGETVLEFLLNISTISFWTNHFGAWFVGALIPLYIIAPFYKKIRSNLLCGIILCAILSTAAAFNYFDNDILHNISFALCRVPCFFIGMQLGKYVKQETKIPWVYVPVMLILMLILQRMPILKLVRWHWILSIAVAIIAAYLISILNTKIRNILSLFGKVSLESYLSNIYLCDVLSVISWVAFGIDFNYGNLVYYLFVIVLGIQISFGVNSLINRIRVK